MTVLRVAVVTAALSGRTKVETMAVQMGRTSAGYLVDRMGRW